MWAIDILNIDILEPGSLRVTDDDAKVKLCSEDGRLCKPKRFANKKASRTVSSFGVIFIERTWETEKRVVRRCTVSKFSAGGCMFYPGFSETQEVRVVRADEARYRNRMKRLKNRSGTLHMVKLTGPEFSSMSPERRRSRRQGVRQ